MREALRLARRGEGLTRPNPPVGAVVVRGDRCVGRGTHLRAGAAHAEIKALRAAGSAARGSTLVVTLEPCSTTGRTGPCTDAVLAAGIRRVVVASRDPNPAHAGRGLRILRRAGLEVVSGVLRREGDALIAPFRTWILHGRSFVTLKLGVTLDGRIADAGGRSQWITGAAARREVQRLRRRADAVLIGTRTALRDNPKLTVRRSVRHSPARVVLDARGRLPLSAAVLNDDLASRTIVVVGRDCPERRQRAYTRRGATVWVLPGRTTSLSVKRLVHRLGRAGFLHVLCEGGGELAASLMRARCVDAYRFFVAPAVLGGGGVPAVGGRGWRLADAPRLRFTEVTRIGEDLMIGAEPA